MISPTWDLLWPPGHWIACLGCCHLVVVNKNQGASNQFDSTLCFTFSCKAWSSSTIVSLSGWIVPFWCDILNLEWHCEVGYVLFCLPSDPTDCSLPGSSVHGILQARVLEWGAIAFSNYVTQPLINFMNHSWPVSEVVMPPLQGSMGAPVKAHRVPGQYCVWIVTILLVS